MVDNLGPAGLRADLLLVFRREGQPCISVGMATFCPTAPTFYGDAKKHVRFFKILRELSAGGKRD